MEAVAEPTPGQGAPQGSVTPGPPPPDSGSEPGFQPIDDTQVTGEPGFQDLPPALEPVIPFTGEDLVQAATWLLLLGVRPQTEEEARAFTEAFRRGILPMLPPAAVLDYLKVGEALAAYGIGKNRLPTVGSVDAMPPWLRILLGGVVLGVSAYGGVRALLDVRAARSSGPSPHGGDPDERAESTP